MQVPRRAQEAGQPLDQLSKAPLQAQHRLGHGHLAAEPPILPGRAGCTLHSHIETPSGSGASYLPAVLVAPVTRTMAGGAYAPAMADAGGS